MDKVLLQEAIKLNKARKHRMWWHHLVRSLAAVVIFCTTYALILPAITMTRDTICGMEEHTHGQNCQQIVLLVIVQQCTFAGFEINTEHSFVFFNFEREIVCYVF